MEHDGLLDRARTLLELQRPEAAEKALREYLAREANDPVGLVLLSHACCDQEKYGAAVEAARAAMGVAPEYDMALFHLGRAQLASGNAHAAVLTAGDALRIDPREPRHHALRARAYHVLGRGNEALAAANAGLALAPDDAELLQLRGFILLAQGNLKEARGTQRAALAADPGAAEAHRLSGVTALHAARYKEARAHFKEALRLDPNDEHARAAMLEVMRATFLPYRLWQMLMLWRMRTPFWQIALILVGFVWVVGSLGAIGLGRVAGVVIVVGLVGFVVLFKFGFMISPVADALLLLHPFGRAVLGPVEKRDAAVALVGLAMIVAAVVVLLAGGRSVFIALALFGFVLWMMAAWTRTFEKQANAEIHWRLTQLAMVWGGAGVVLLALNGPLATGGATLLVTLGLAVVGYSWIKALFMR